MVNKDTILFAIASFFRTGTMNRFLEKLSSKTSTLMSKAHSALDKPSRWFYVTVLAMPSLALVAGLALVVPGPSVNSDEAISAEKAMDIEERKQSDAIARRLESEKAQRQANLRNDTRSEYADLIRANADLSQEVAGLQKSAGIRAYILFQKAEEERAKAEKARNDAAMKSAVAGQLQATQAEACVSAKAQYEANKSRYSPAELDESLQALNNLCK